MDLLAELGYTRVVLPPVDPDAIDAVALGRLFADRNLVPVPIAGQSPDADVSSTDAGVRAAGAEALRRMVRLTSDLGGDQLNGVLYGLFGRASHASGLDALERSAASSVRSQTPPNATVCDSLSKCSTATRRP